MKKLAIYFILSNFVKPIPMDEFSKERYRLLHRDASQMLGSDIVLSDSEQEVNEIFINLKSTEIDEGLKNPQTFVLSKHFFEYKDEVKDTMLFKLIQKMPKGAVLHAHDTGLLGPDYVLQLTYMPNLYVSFSSSGTPNFRFSKTKPEIPCDTEWKLMEDVRRASGNVAKFDNQLRSNFTLVVNNPYSEYPDINSVWAKFQNYFISTSGLFTYKPIWEKYFYDSLKAFRQDNVMYVEIRSVLPELYDLEGNIYNSVETAMSYLEVSNRFCSDYPDFFGAKLIYAPMRLVNIEVVKDYLEIANRIKTLAPDFLVGFDLVGQEDVGEPLREFIPVLTEAAHDLDYFFHAGETNWYGTSSDENLADAILLGSKRIGHGFALIKHPVLLEEVKKRDIAVESNVISNSVLKLVSDVRNHPVASLIARNVPVVLSSDDPGVWEADPLSHDFYVTFVAVTSQSADLKLLKKLAYNSLNYSAYPDKDKLRNEFDIRWARFILSVLSNKWMNC